MNWGNTGSLGNLERIEFYNESSLQIPAFGCMRITGMTTLDGREVVKVNQPNTYGSQYLHLFNGPTVVETGKYGVAYFGYQVSALYDTADGTPAFGERWGPRASTWKLKKNTGGWQIVGNVNSTNGIVIVTRAPFLSFHGVTDAAINKDATGDVSIHYRSGSSAYTDTTVNMTGVLNKFGNVGSSKDVRCVWDDDGTTSGVGWWEIVAAECS